MGVLQILLTSLVSMLTVVITLYGLFRTNRWIKLNNTFEVLDSFYHELTADSVPIQLRLVSKLWFGEKEAKRYFKENESVVYDILNRFEIFSIKIRSHYINSSIVEDFYEQMIIDYYENVILIFLNIIREERNNQNLNIYENISYIYKEWKN